MYCYTNIHCSLFTVYCFANIHCSFFRSALFVPMFVVALSPCSYKFRTFFCSVLFPLELSMFLEAKHFLKFLRHTSQMELVFIVRFRWHAAHIMYALVHVYIWMYMCWCRSTLKLVDCMSTCLVQCRTFRRDLSFGFSSRFLRIKFSPAMGAYFAQNA